MGRFNVNQIMYMIRKNLKGVKWLVPKKYRKYVYLIGGVFGLLAYFNFMLYLTNSKYLIAIKGLIVDLYQFLFTNYDHRLLYALFAIILIVIITRYFRQPDIEEKDGVKKSNGSIYYQVNGIISVSYLGITILGLLPVFI